MYLSCSTFKVVGDATDSAAALALCSGADVVVSLLTPRPQVR
jgi:hypothetical protein